MINEMVVIDESQDEMFHLCSVCDCQAEKLIMISQELEGYWELYICKKCLTGIINQLGGDVKWL